MTSTRNDAAIVSSSPDGASAGITLREDAATAFKGVLMGCADVVPGVSGGTVALIVGIYQRLVTALSRIDGHLFGLLGRRAWSEAARYLDVRFLIALACGIVVGFATMTIFLQRLLSHPTTFALTMAAFFGLILGSSILVGALVRPRSRRQAIICVGLGLLGAAIAVWISFLETPKPTVGAAPHLGYVFLCGMIGICAMILPGISGAMMLLLLGVYAYLTDIPRSLLHGEEFFTNLSALLVFAAGCCVGLLSFSKILRWLLSKHHSATLALLCGFMIGALPKIWPFQRDLTPDIAKFKYKLLKPYVPVAWDGLVGGVLLTVLLAVGVVLIAHRTARRFASTARGG